MKIAVPLLFALAVTAGSGCKQQVDTKAEGAKLMQVSRDWSKAAADRDVEKTLAYWKDDATVISANEPVITDKKGVRAMIEGSYKNPSFHISWEPVSVEISQSGDMGYLIEDATITVDGPEGKPMVQKYKSVTIWKKQEDGSWKNTVDVMSPLPKK